MPQGEVVFMRFTCAYPDRGYDYFAGSSEEEILKDTHDGKGFGFCRYEAPGVVVGRDFVERLGFDGFPHATRVIEKAGATKTFFLGRCSEDPASA